jgi:uncharacterized protein
LNKKKIINDPVYGFISINHDIIFDLIEHRYFQRLRRIQQLGLTSFVYPGAMHSRFQHALGAMHLMALSLEVLRSKGIEITTEEAEAVTIAILLHDIGHGPYSHALEHTIISSINHEAISKIIMDDLNKEFNGQLSLAIKIFTNNYRKKFLHDLVSSQLDMDRLDYLNRDSFFTGVYEGVIGYDRIIKMLNVHKDRLVVEGKGIYSIEKFIIARRLMYWQVYLHKTVLSAEHMVVKILQRAMWLVRNGNNLATNEPLMFFLNNEVKPKDFLSRKVALNHFTEMDDYDVFAAIKNWQRADDAILATLCKNLVQRHLNKVHLRNNKFDAKEVEALQKKAETLFKLKKGEGKYMVYTDSTSNYAYKSDEERINILLKKGTVLDIADASDQLNIRMLSAPVIKYFLSYPKELSDD